MARDLIPTQTPGQDGAEIATVAGDDVDGHILDGGGRVMLYVVNGAVDVNVTIQTGATLSGLAVTDLVVTVPATETWLIGPFRSATFDRPSGAAVDPGQVHVDLDDASNVTVGAIGL